MTGIGVAVLRVIWKREKNETNDGTQDSGICCQFRTSPSVLIGRLFAPEAHVSRRQPAEPDWSV